MKKSQPETVKRLRQRTRRIYDRLLSTYPDVHCTLDNISPTQFLLASILSPQCTDVTANRVSKELWKKYPTIGKIASAPPDKIAAIVKPCGMYRVKSRYIQDSAKKLIAGFAGVVPHTLKDLMTFPGVGRKVALVILLEVHGIVEGIIIDTHNIRLANRLGLSTARDPVKLEKHLMKIVARTHWMLWSHLMVFHGRACCTARNPNCRECPVLSDCMYDKKNL
jgi:endonuclease III